MTIGNTTTADLTDSMPSVISSARIVAEYNGVMTKLVDNETLGQGIGNSWNEISLAQLTAQAVTEQTVLNNPQQLQDTLFTITPTMVGIHTFITDKVSERISKNVFAKTGGLAMNAIVRKMDDDGLAVLDGATNSFGGAGATLTSGHISAAAYRITSNPTETVDGPIRAVLHGFQLKDLADELTSGVGTYPVPEGPTAKVYREKFRGMIAGAEVFEDGNITIDGSDDAKGGVFAKSGIVMVKGSKLRTETRREPDIGGGGTSMWIYADYAFGERLAGGSTSAWVNEILSDATAPTS